MGLFDVFKKEPNKKENKIIIVPLKSFNEIEFGTSRKELWKRIGKPKKSFKKNPTSVVETDVYENYYIYYDVNYTFEAIEIFEQLDIYYNGDKLSQRYSELLEYFKKQYDDVEEDRNGFVSHKGSIGVYIENDDDKIDSILFAKRNYYGK